MVSWLFSSCQRFVAKIHGHVLINFVSYLTHSNKSTRHFKRCLKKPCCWAVPPPLNHGKTGHRRPSLRLGSPNFRKEETSNQTINFWVQTAVCLKRGVYIKNLTIINVYKQTAGCSSILQDSTCLPVILSQ